MKKNIYNDEFNTNGILEYIIELEDEAENKTIDTLEYYYQRDAAYANITINHHNDLPEDDIPDSIWETLTIHNDPNKEDEKEHANYTPQTDITPKEDGDEE